LAIRIERRARQVVRGFQPTRHRLGLAAVKIDFGPVAGRQDGSFLDHAPVGQLAQRTGQRVGRERHPLPDIERCRRMVKPQRVERHRGGFRTRAPITTEGGRSILWFGDGHSTAVNLEGGGATF